MYESHDKARLLRNASEDHFRKVALEAAKTLGPNRPRFPGGDYAVIATVEACMGLEDHFVQFGRCSRVEAQNHASEILGRERVEKIFFAIENILAQKTDTPVDRLGRLNMQITEHAGFNGTSAEDLRGADLLAPDGQDC